MKKLFKSETGKTAIMELYEHKLEELQIDYQYKTVESSFGEINIIESGSEENPPLIIVHGSNACAPIALETYPKLSTKYRVFAVDVPGQPNKSTETALNMKTLDHGKWMNEVIEALNLEEVTLAGFSLGGLVILKTLLYNASKVKEVFLAAPAFIVNGSPLKAIFKVFIPMRRYMRSKNQKYIRQFLAELFTDEDEFALQYLSEVFLHFQMDFSLVPVIKKKEAATIQTPISLFAAGDDLLFPGKRMLKRAKKIFPSLKAAILLKESKHVQNRKDNNLIESYILKN